MIIKKEIDIGIDSMVPVLLIYLIAIIWLITMVFMFFDDIAEGQ